MNPPGLDSIDLVQKKKSYQFDYLVSTVSSLFWTFPRRLLSKSIFSAPLVTCQQSQDSGPVLLTHLHPLTTSPIACLLVTFKLISLACLHLPSFRSIKLLEKYLNVTRSWSYLSLDPV